MKAKKILFPLISLLMVLSLIPNVSADIIIIGGSEDIVPPDLVYFEIIPDTIDTGASSQIVTFILQITDEMSGFNHLIMYLTSPSEQQGHSLLVNLNDLDDGDEYDGRYISTFEFPQYSESGTWKISMRIQDDVTNTRIISPQDILDRGFSPYVYISGGPDLAPPIILDLQIDPDTIDVNEYSRKVNFTFHITDEIAGFNYLVAYIRSPSRRQFRAIVVGHGYPISGDVNDGIFRRTIEFPEHHEAGTWFIEYLNIYDKVRNHRQIFRQKLIDAGFETNLEIISDPHDIIAPVLESLDIDPRLVDTSAGPQTVYFTFTISDHLAGLLYLILWLKSPSLGQQWRIQVVARNLLSGDVFSGIYRQSIILPQYSETGTWRITQLCMVDNVTNTRCFSYQNLVDGGYNPDLEVVDTAEAIVDFDPNTLNLLSEGVPVTVYIELPADSDYTVQDIDVRTILLNGQISILYWPFTIGDYDQDGIPDLMVKFDRALVQSILGVGKEIEITISGQFTSGVSFEGIDIIKVMSK